MAMVQTKRLAALLLALLLTLFLLPSAWADSGVVGGTTVSGTVRVYLSSISRLTAVAPHTPRPNGMRAQAGLPWNGPTSRSLPSPFLDGTVK